MDSEHPPEAGTTEDVTVALVDDHQMVRQNLERALAAARPRMRFVYSGDDPSAAAAIDPLPDLLILDLNLHEQPPDIDVVTTLVGCGCAVLVLSALGEPETVHKMVSVGVGGFVSKEESIEELLTAIDTVLSGDTWTTPALARVLLEHTNKAKPPLTPTEEKVLQKVGNGTTISAIGNQLGMSENTVKTHIKRMREKFSNAGRPANSQAALTREAIRRGLVDG